MSQDLFVIFKGDADDEDDSYQRVFLDHGKRVLKIPVLSFKFINLSVLYERLSHNDSYSGIIFTSQRAVKSVKEALKNDLGSELIGQIRQKLLFSVGVQTSKCLKTELFLEDSIGSKISELGSGESLARYIVKNHSHELKNDKKLLFPCSSIARDVMSKILAENSIQIERIECYETCSDPNLMENLRKLLDQHGDKTLYFVLFSPSGCEKVIDTIKRLQFSIDSVKLIAIGKTTRDSIEKQGLSAFCTSEKPTPEALISTVLESLAQKSTPGC